MERWREKGGGMEGEGGERRRRWNKDFIICHRTLNRVPRL